MMKKIRFGIIGCGNMASSIIERLYKSENAGGYRFDIAVSDLKHEQLERVKGFGVRTETDNRRLANDSDMVLLAVKPQSFSEAVKGVDFQNKPVLSIMAGVPLKKLAELTGS